MKNLAALAVTLGLIAGAANAENVASEASELTLAMNSDRANLWVVPKTAMKIDNPSLDNQIELKVNRNMQKVSDELNKQLEAKIAKELEHAVQ